MTRDRTLVLRRLLKKATRYAGYEVFRTSSDEFRWSHTVEDYYPITPKARWHEGELPYSHLYKAIDRNRADYLEFIHRLCSNTELIHGIGHHEVASDPDRPFWHNLFFLGLDAASLVTFISWKRPVRYFEIGSGHSTRFAKYTINGLKLATQITSIDPAPRDTIDRICNRVIRHPLETCDLSIFDELEAKDILFFDGSHRAFPNSDVIVFFFEVLPRLKSGVIVHIHDIFLPYDYPEYWMHRLYNEQYILASMLMCAKPPFRILAPIAFICRDSDLGGAAKRAFVSPNGERDIPFVDGGSFWLEVENQNI